MQFQESRPNMIRAANSQVPNSNIDADGRFAHLLNPIRDLAKNWEIDIAAYLEEYLAELEGITITFNDGATTLNFAQAALLIQGTACVYSKKVEYLYNLVFQMLDLLSTKRQMQQQQQKNADETVRGNSTLQAMEETHFLSLDDIKEQNNLEMNENITLLNKRKSSIQLLPCMPTSLIPLDEGEKGNIVLYSKKGEVLGNKNDYRLNTCSIHHSGALLLHLCNGEDLGQARPFATESEAELGNRFSNGSLLGSDICDNTCTSPPHSPLPLDNEDANDLCRANGEVLPAQLLPAIIDQELPTQNKVVSSPNKEVPTPRRSARLQKRLSSENKVKVEPWKTEEPHEEKQQCKACKGRSSKLPKKLQQKKSQTRKKANKPLQLPPVTKFCGNAYFSHTFKFPKNHLKIPEMVEVEYVYWAEKKAREKFWKDKQKRKPLEEKMAENEEDINCDDVGNHSNSCDDDDDDSNAADPDVPGAFDVQNDEQEDNSLSAPVLESEIQVVSSYENLVQKYVENYLSSAAQYCQMTELTRRVNEWEDEIRPKLQEEERHESFDIHSYGSRVLDCFSDNDRKQTIDFSTICHGKRPWEISRYFSSTLQLANTYNIKIDNTGEMDSFELTLLSRKRHHEELEQFDPS